MKSRWSTNFDDLERYYLKLRIRSEEYAEHTQKYEHFPTSYRCRIPEELRCKQQF